MRYVCLVPQDTNQMCPDVQGETLKAKKSLIENYTKDVDMVQIHIFFANILNTLSFNPHDLNNDPILKKMNIIYQ